MKRLTLILLFSITGNLLLAQQAKLTTSGSIQFEKTVNTYPIVKKSGISDKNYEDYKARFPQFVTLKSTLFFNGNQTLFVPTHSDAPPAMINSNVPLPFVEQRNLIYTDLSTNRSVNQKNVLGEILLEKDSVRKIKWKITDEFRDIAGFTCRRANGLIMDSIYVVAFYTNEIHIPGGPESFTGLPGLILQVALPHENVIWRAIQVTESAIPDNTIIAPQNGTVVNRRQLDNRVKSSMMNVDGKLKALLIKDMLL